MLQPVLSFLNSNWPTLLMAAVLTGLIVVVDFRRRQRQPVQVAEVQQQPSEPMLEAVLALPLPALTLFGSGLAVAFNLGFFWAVGIVFMSLFSIQEHVVFAISGLVDVSAFLVGVHS